MSVEGKIVAAGRLRGRQSGRARRLGVAGAAVRRVDGTAHVFKLSRTNVVFETAVPLMPGDPVTLQFSADECHRANVVWTTRRLCSCRFANPVPKSLVDCDLTAMGGPPSPPVHAAHTAACGCEAQETFGVRLEKLRRQHGLSRAELARLLGVSTVTVWKWETDKAFPRRSRGAAIARALDLTEPGFRSGCSLRGDAGAGAKGRLAEKATGAVSLRRAVADGLTDGGDGHANGLLKMVGELLERE